MSSGAATMQSSPLLRLPPEVIERILTDPRVSSVHVAHLAACCRSLHTLVYDRSDSHLWRTLYLNEFDDPRRREQWSWGKEKEVDWMGEYQRRSKGVRMAMSSHIKTSHGVKCMLASPQPINTHGMFAALAEIADTALPIDVEPESKNIGILKRIAGTSRLGFNNDLSSERPRVRMPVPVADEAWFHFILGEGGHAAFDRKLYRHAQSVVFSLATYYVSRRRFAFSPFSAEDSSVNWQLVEALVAVMMSTVRQWLHDPDSPDDVAELFRGMQSGPEHLQIGTQPGWSDRAANDWAGIAGSWSGSYWFLDHGDFLMFNSESSLSADLGSSCGGKLKMKLKLVPYLRTISNLSADAVSAFPEHRPTLFFEGVSISQGFEVDVSGCVSYRADGRVRWDYVVSYGFMERWRLIGFQYKEGARIGVVGVWSPADADPDGPVGPFWYWKESPDAVEEGG